MKHFDVIVIGGGHAGAEAAAASARMGARTALISLRRDGIGVMSCNPAIGGLGKGHLVREIDAMDGIMGLAADRAAIQYRLLNRRKGPAVQGPRAQADRKLYRVAIQDLLSAEANLTILEGEVVALKQENGRVTGVTLADSVDVTTGAVVLTTGTFLNGVIHVGDQRRPGGRMGDRPSVLLAEQLAALGLARGRLKTGTPPRLDGTTINWDVLEVQPGDEDPVVFSFMNKQPQVRQIACGITHTNENTHEIVRKNLSRSAMYGGHIEGIGPRYCPSIEDKIVRFADKTSHQVFLEPEGLDDSTVYPNGISTSLPQDVQEAYVRSIVGLENVRITQPGYAIEYDYFDPRALDLSLQLKAMPGLFLAGQINGTTGYEEAAAQGLLAGLNAAALAQAKDPVHFSRAESYIGVMVDDLTTRGVTEPYRMFTSRAEYRLTLRADNADQRLTPVGLDLGCVGDDRKAAFLSKSERLAAAAGILQQKAFSPTELHKVGIMLSQDGARRTAQALMALPDVTVWQIAELVPEFARFTPEIQQQTATDALYAQYVDRQKLEIAALKREESAEIPGGFVFTGLPGLSNELGLKLSHIRPANLAQAARIEGMTPAALTLILAHIRKARREAVAQ
ncbi:MAG: tRNA uridine-5-carboxymethylaminomethyl(34) synthesis enzyme MnmG [Cypionkella sp.]|uniref:tRNA uridine-5-carboxymethylaminomethyl(34) synthesis enzyme MnmG n=1 Tax=Cypionkella sp. TaxID=2811411 RepID=UPI002AB9ABB8|nr:tRNA uridine-5-carboxymethylaminomethyl(34) synthesis enzyme MnmG [Cypionkella sp.]MDZ4312272.1 tRNA uridine-5-carboxymethylaminomethyl(34) synthesis enzyme MnmG [Cypionkella sp.]MDZ4391564.1 tRNA uridine-5-carboxymethylaminomethyl(34) synthesis enzyme MnmG [Cypionkella sp.]